MKSAQLNTQLIMILDNLEEGIIAFDADEKLVFYNGTAASILGLRLGARKEYGAKGLFGAKNPEFYGLLRDALRGRTAGGTAETVYRKGKRELMLRAHTYLTEAGFLFTIIQDVTELWSLSRKERSLARQVHRQYENLVESLRQIADSVAHEVRNPIVSIGGYANLLLRKCAEKEHDVDETRKFLGYIRDDAERLNRIVAGVERYSDLAGVRFARENIIPLLRKVLRKARGPASKKSLAFRAGRIETAEYFAWIDAEKMAGALEEIIGRSIAACSPGTGYRVSVSLSVYELSLRIELDEGVVRGEDLQFIFDPFYNGQGGMNLAAAQRIIVLHGGLIRASRRGARGLTLRVTIPKERRTGRG